MELADDVVITERGVPEVLPVGTRWRAENPLGAAYQDRATERDADVEALMAKLAASEARGAKLYGALVKERERRRKAERAIEDIEDEVEFA